MFRSTIASKLRKAKVKPLKAAAKHVSRSFAVAAPVEDLTTGMEQFSAQSLDAEYDQDYSKAVKFLFEEKRYGQVVNYARDPVRTVSVG